VLIDLVDHRQVIVRPFPSSPMDFVYSDGMDLFQHPMRQAPLHHPFHRTIDTLPTGAERPRRLPPTQLARPTGQKQHHRDGYRPLAIAPRHMLDDHSMLAALHSPRRVPQKHSQTPQRHKIPAPRGQVIVSRSGLLAARTACPHSGMRFHAGFDESVLSFYAHLDLPVDEACQGVHPVQ
jgi:hypothetical protein